MTRAIEVKCPVCGATPVAYCIGAIGYHRERIELASRTTRVANASRRTVDEIVVEPLPPCRACDGCREFAGMLDALRLVDKIMLPAVDAAIRASEWADKHGSRDARSLAMRAKSAKQEWITERWRLVSIVAAKATCLRIGFVLRRITKEELAL